MNMIGHNNPPSQIDAAKSTLADLILFAKENPAVTGEENARAANLQVSRGKLVLKDLDGERDARVRPLNQVVKEINAEYKAASGPLATAVEAIEKTLKDYLREEERKRAKEAEEKRRAAEEARLAAIRAEEKEREALADAAVGDLDASRVEATIEADAAFSRFERAQRDADRADRDKVARAGGGFGRAASLRTVERLDIVDIATAAVALASDAEFLDAIRSAARRFRKDWGSLPAGVVSVQERV
jgi:hypothetical protein